MGLSGGIKKTAIFVISAVIFVAGLYLAALAYSESHEKYFSLTEPQLVIGAGPPGAFDCSMAHTLSVVELNRNGYRFWGYYTGRDHKKVDTDIGLAYSNDLVHWVKDESSPVVRDLRWGTVVVADGIINMFGTRNYGGDTKIVRLISEDGKHFKEQETAVPSVKGEKHQNPFIFWDETEGLYRLYYFHLVGNNNRIEEKHSSSIEGLAGARANLVMSDDEHILAAPSVFFREGRYWLTAETFREVNGIGKWQTLAFVSDHPLRGFEPVENSFLLVNNDACFFPYIFDNCLNGFYSHQNENGTWHLFRVAHDFEKKDRIKLAGHGLLTVNGTRQLHAYQVQPDGTEKDVTAAAVWATSDNSVVTVQKGKITGKKEGSAIITVSYGGASVSEYINVSPVW